jgi:BlaI family penicillinase repressor
MFGKPNLVCQTLDGKEAVPMSRPAAKDLTERELQLMQVYWKHGPLTAIEARTHLATNGPELTYTTVATLVRILHDKGFLTQTNNERPFVYAPAKSLEEVTGRLLGDVLDRVFGGSREQLLMRLLEQRNLTKRERAFLEGILEEEA